MSEAKDDQLDALIDAAAGVLALPVEPAWKPAIKANQQVTLRLAAMVAEFELLDRPSSHPCSGPEPMGTWASASEIAAAVAAGTSSATSVVEQR